MLIIIFGVTALTNEIAILTTKNGKILENHLIDEEEAYSLAYFNIFNDLNVENVMDLFFSQPNYIYDAVETLIDLEIQEKYVLDKGLTIDSTSNFYSEDIDNEKVKNNLSTIFGQKKKQEEMIKKQLKSERSLEEFISNNKKDLLDKYDVFIVEQYNITVPSTPNETFFKVSLESTPTNDYIVYNKEDLKNFEDFKNFKLNGYNIFYNDDSFYSIEEILDPAKFLDYGLSEEISKYYENTLIFSWENQYPNNFDFILTYKPLKIQDRIHKLENKNFENLIELKNFYFDIIFNEEEIPELWYISYYNILRELDTLFLEKIDKLESLDESLPEEFFEKNYSELQKITEESTNSTLTNYINFYKDIIYENSEINSLDSYLEFLNNYKSDYEEILIYKNEILGLIILQNYDFFVGILADRFDLTEDLALVEFYNYFFEYLKSMEVGKDSNVYLALLENLNLLNGENEEKLFSDIINNIQKHIEMNENE
jgi:hypothetical protein